MTQMTFTQLLRAALLTALSTLLLASHSYAGLEEAETPVDITGELTALYVDDFENKRAELQYFIEDKQSRKRYRLIFEGTPPGHLGSGSQARVRGKAKGRDLIVEANGTGEQNIEIVAPAAVTVAGEQNTLVMVSNFSDTAVSCSVDAIRDLMFTDPSDNSVDDLYQETSFAAVWLAGQVIGPYDINYSSDGCDYSAWGDAADLAARASGIEPNTYDRKVYVLPQNGCPAAGVGTIGGNPSRAWVFHCNIADIFAHELGHNLGMHHAATPTSAYGDNSDVMGIGQNRLRQINAPHKEQMGWLTDAPAQLISESGYYDIAPLELHAFDALAPRALKILKADSNEYYYLSYRRGIGFDANLSASLYLDRLSVHKYPGDGSAVMTYLLATPTDGESFVDTVNGITVTQLSHNDDYVTVQVQLDGSPPDPTPTCTVGTPLLSLSPTSQSAEAGNTLSYTVALTNNDSETCTQSTFTLTSNYPSGWMVTLSPTSLSLAPGQSGSATLSVTSADTASAGSYGLQVEVSDALEPVHAAVKSSGYEVIEIVQSDTEPPSAPSGLTASETSKQVSLSWSASSDNVGVLGYRIWRDGVIVANTADPSYVDRDLANGVLYEYSVDAYDAATNISDKSTPVTAGKVTKGKSTGGSGGKGKGSNK